MLSPCVTLYNDKAKKKGTNSTDKMQVHSGLSTNALIQQLLGGSPNKDKAP